MTSNVTQLNQRENGLPRQLDKEECLKLVRELVAEGGRISVMQHAYDRMEERDITMSQVTTVLGRGEIVGGPEWSTDFSNWKFTMQADTAGQLVKVAGAIDRDIMGVSILVLTVC